MMKIRKKSKPIYSETAATLAPKKQKPDCFDVLGSYTGTPEGSTTPTQDADDL